MASTVKIMGDGDLNKPSSMSNSNAWNQLIRNVSGIIYKTDIGWNNQPLGEILIDDLCFAIMEQ